MLFKSLSGKCQIVLFLGILFLFVFCGSAKADDLLSDTWVATDAIGRELPGYNECGAPRSDRYVGIFYFLWLVVN